MSHKHDNLIRAIFHDPVSGNIQWREIESLLRHLGATTESLSGTRVRVKLNGAEGILHRPHGGNTLGRQDITASARIPCACADHAVALRGPGQGVAGSTARVPFSFVAPFVPRRLHVAT